MQNGGCLRIKRLGSCLIKSPTKTGVFSTRTGGGNGAHSILAIFGGLLEKSGTPDHRIPENWYYLRICSRIAGRIIRPSFNAILIF